MQVKILAFSRSPKPSVLASVRLELNAETGDSITVDDARLLRNRAGQVWLALPAYSIPTNGGRSYDYRPAVVLSAQLMRQVVDAVLPAFEVWEREQAGVER
jgi:hypothetical protein